LEFYFRYRFRPYHRSRHVILQHTLCQISSTSDRPPQKNDMSTLKMADLRHLEFRDPIMGSLQGWVRGQHVRGLEAKASSLRGQGQYLRGQSQWSWLLKKNKKMTFLIKIHSSINCLVIFFYRKSRFSVRILATDKQINSPNALSHLRYRKRRLNNT